MLADSEAVLGSEPSSALAVFLSAITLLSSLLAIRLHASPPLAYL